MKIQDLTNSVKTAVHERSRNPIAGALIISWCIWNWKFLYYVINPGENVSFERKMTYINSNFLNNDWNLYWRPIISATILILVVPLLSYLTNWFSSWIEKEKNIKRTNILDDAPLERSKAKKLLVELRELDAKHLESIMEKEQEVSELLDENRELSSRNEDLQNQIITNEKNLKIQRINSLNMTINVLKNQQSVYLNNLIEKDRFDLERFVKLAEKKFPGPVPKDKYFFEQCRDHGLISLTSLNSPNKPQLLTLGKLLIELYDNN